MLAAIAAMRMRKTNWRTSCSDETLNTANSQGNHKNLSGCRDGAHLGRPTVSSIHRRTVPRSTQGCVGNRSLIQRNCQDQIVAFSEMVCVKNVQPNGDGAREENQKKIRSTRTAVSSRSNARIFHKLACFTQTTYLGDIFLLEEDEDSFLRGFLAPSFSTAVKESIGT